jgi:hypothetical protein
MEEVWRGEHERTGLPGNLRFVDASIYNLTSSPKAMYMFDPQPGDWTSTTLGCGELVVV